MSLQDQIISFEKDCIFFLTVSFKEYFLDFTF